MMPVWARKTPQGYTPDPENMGYLARRLGGGCGVSSIHVGGGGWRPGDGRDQA